MEVSPRVCVARSMNSSLIPSSSMAILSTVCAVGQRPCSLRSSPICINCQNKWFPPIESEKYTERHPVELEVTVNMSTLGQRLERQILLGSGYLRRHNNARNQDGSVVGIVYSQKSFAPSVETVVDVPRCSHPQSFCDPRHRHRRFLSQTRCQFHFHYVIRQKACTCQRVLELASPRVVINFSGSSSSRKMASRRSPRLVT
jgi:hypothetical protein